ncbi:MAG: hypothetical protein KBS52_03765 [Clostridiales bacterium]|nr:hypothetical protein [Candidatus Equinaster intestinalis]
MTVLVALNMILESCGVKVIPANEGTVGAIVEAVVEIGAIVCAFWYNNSFTPAACKADAFFKELKNEGEEENV